MSDKFWTDLMHASKEAVGVIKAMLFENVLLGYLFLFFKENCTLSIFSMYLRPAMIVAALDN